MSQLTTLSGRAVSIAMAHINTDLIIPAKYLTSTEKTGYGNYLFKQLRETIKDFPLNLEKHNGAEILVTLENFGCGSSREHAVWALVQYGFKAIIAPSYSDIFYSNSIKNRLPLITLPLEEVQQLMQAIQVCADIEISLSEKTVKTLSGIMKFEMDDYTQYRLIHGVDDIDYILNHKEKIQEYFVKKEREWKLRGAFRAKQGEGALP